ncbi:hypothetical protein Acj9p047 [Acinetobacter phage Acj9]|uniref:Uncharacterized protein n=1 Tax=Acinetobacter phage Acj9 TaxID=760939 RepID=E5EPI1_9CAUD|nr:hypothetical protein Acj9p047 [Acinetobacter phage Acj9]ADG59947.1 conserved hypothetical protein [Acinetobacter phage Acj9]
MTIKATGFISAFPGTGKSSVHGNNHKHGLYAVRANGTSLYRHMPAPGQTYVYDSDSSTFDKAEFPQNYIDHMRAVIQRHAGSQNPFLFLGSSHDNVRAAMQEMGIPYVLVYPHRDLKEQYIERYKKRGSSEFFINLMETKWDEFIDSCEADPSHKIVLHDGQYLSDVL